MSTTLTLTCGLTENPRTNPILSGEVAPEGIRLESLGLHPSELFWRQLHRSEFDVSEMSVSSLTIASAQGPTEWVGIPVFTSRKFFHTGVIVRSDRGIKTPQDLAGKTVGVPEYQQTWAVWTRGVLRDEFGLQPSSMKWFMERTPELSHGSATGFTPPPGVQLRYVPVDTNLGEIFVNGDLDALMHYSRATNLVDRSTIDPLADGIGRRLFDQDAEARRYYEKAGVFPINHCVVVRRSIAEEHPWVVTSLFEAFSRAKAANPTIDGYPVDYGIASGPQKTLETIARFLHEDGLTSRRVALDEVFAPSTLAL